MAERQGSRGFGGCGSILNNDTVLWFIILFLLLFCGCCGVSSNVGNVGGC